MEKLPDFPVVSVDTHFINIPGFQNIEVDAHGFANMLIDLGVPQEKVGSQNRLYIRPDYSLAYTRRERIMKYLRNSDDYFDAGSCARNDEGGVDIEIVYGSGFGVNKLLRHETFHAVKMLRAEDEQEPTSILWTLLHLRRRVREHFLEEKEADKLMKDKDLKTKYGKIIEIEKNKN